MKKDVAKQKLREALEGMTTHEKFQALLDSLDTDEVLQISAWILGNAAMSMGASKAVVKVNTKKGLYALDFVAGRGQSLQLKGEE